MASTVAERYRTRLAAEVSGSSLAGGSSLRGYSYLSGQRAGSSPASAANYRQNLTEATETKGGE